MSTADEKTEKGLPVPTFGEAEQAVLEEARDRFEFEQRSAGTLHAKGVLFLTLTGVFAAFLTSTIGRLLDNGDRSTLETAALAVFAGCLGVLFTVALLLGRSAVSHRYQIVAGPVHWVRHVTRLRQIYASYDSVELRVSAHLRHDLLEKWAEAVEHCKATNEVKAKSLERILLLLTIAVTLSFLGFFLIVLRALFLL